MSTKIVVLPGVIGAIGAAVVQIEISMPEHSVALDQVIVTAGGDPDPILPVVRDCVAVDFVVSGIVNADAIAGVAVHSVAPNNVAVGGFSESYPEPAVEVTVCRDVVGGNAVVGRARHIESPAARIN